MANENNNPRNGMRARAVEYMLDNGGKADKLELAWFLGIGTPTVDSLMRGGWGRNIVTCSGNVGRVEYTIEDEEKARKFVEEQNLVKGYIGEEGM